MSLPPPLVGVTVTATLRTGGSTPLQGATVTLTPRTPATSPAGDVPLTPTALSRTTASDGTAQRLNVRLSDSPGLSNPMPYRVTIVKDNALIQQPYTVELLSSMVVGGLLKLAAHTPSTPAPPLSTHLLAVIPVPAGFPVKRVEGRRAGAGTCAAAGTPAQVRFWDFNGAPIGTTPDDPSRWLTKGWRTAT